MKKDRTQARILGMQFLYQIDLRGREIIIQLENFLHNHSDSPAIQEYARRLVLGCTQNWDEINQTIQGVARNWRIQRMAVIDRSILRIATFEICYMEDIPHKVAINEAIEMGKSYSLESSGGFINGVLDSIIKQRASRKKVKRI